MTISRYSHPLPPPVPDRAVGLKAPSVLGPTAWRASAGSDVGAGAGPGSVAVEPLRLSLVAGLANDELSDDELPDGGLLKDELANEGLALVDPLSTGSALGPEAVGPPVVAVVSVGSAPMMVSRPGEASEDSFTEVMEARQRM